MEIIFFFCFHLLVRPSVGRSAHPSACCPDFISTGDFGHTIAHLFCFPFWSMVILLQCRAVHTRTNAFVAKGNAELCIFFLLRAFNANLRTPISNAPPPSPDRAALTLIVCTLVRTPITPLLGQIGRPFYPSVLPFLSSFRVSDPFLYKFAKKLFAN